MRALRSILTLEDLREEVQRFLQQEKPELPMRPEVATQAIAMCRREDCDVKELSELIHRDPSMAGHILRIANSPLYLPVVPIVSLHQAVIRLGLRALREITMVICCDTVLFRAQGFTHVLQQVFRHSLAAASFAQEIARSRRLNVEEAFLGGLLHDVGKAILIQHLTNHARKSRARARHEDTISVAEEGHAAVGGLLVRHWDLGQHLCNSITHHHSPDSTPEDAPLPHILRFADDLAHWALGTRPVESQALRKHPMLIPLNLYEEEVHGLLERREHILKTVDALR